MTIALPVDASYAVLLRTQGDPRTLFQELNHRLGGRLMHLTLTNNRRTIVSISTEKGCTAQHPNLLKLRLHHCFSTAPADVLDALAAFVDNSSEAARKKHLATLRKYFAAHQTTDEPRRRNPPRARSQGKVFDLEAIRDQVNERYFGSRLEVAIAWGRRPSRRARKPRTRRRSIHLGTYSADQNLIRVHPVLDQSWVPRLVIESVVHHELLHAAMPAETVRGRRCLHPPEFRRRERFFEGFEEVEAWLEDNLPRLLKSRG